jgi:hypothetical protein
MGLGGVSFQPNPPQAKPPATNDPFNIFGLEMGGGQPQAVQSPPNNGGFGGDLMGFGISSPPPQQPVNPPPVNNLLGGGDLMGFGFTNPPSNPPPNQGGFNFGVGSPQAGFNQPQQPPQPQPNNNNFGFNLLGNSQPAQQAPTSLPAQSTLGFQPIVNNNPNKILAYDNAHLQIWIDCIKESQESTKLFTTYVNKTNNTLSDVTIQAAVLKHVKLTINPLSSTTIQPFSKEVVHQVCYS